MHNYYVQPRYYTDVSKCCESLTDWSIPLTTASQKRTMDSPLLCSSPLRLSVCPQASRTWASRVTCGPWEWFSSPCSTDSSRSTTVHLRSCSARSKLPSTESQGTTSLLQNHVTSCPLFCDEVRNSIVF